MTCDFIEVNICSCSISSCFDLTLFFLANGQMPDVIVDYDMSRQTYSIEHQEEVSCDSVGQSSIPLFGPMHNKIQQACGHKKECVSDSNSQRWKDFSEVYYCQREEVVSHDGVKVPLTIVYSRESWQKGQSPGILVGYGAYGEDLDKSWCSDRLSLLDRGWILAFADVRLLFEIIERECFAYWFFYLFLYIPVDHIRLEVSIMIYI